jgi:hypothetical protein
MGGLRTNRGRIFVIAAIALTPGSKKGRPRLQSDAQISNSTPISMI